MATTGISGMTSSSTVQTPSTGPKEKLDKDAFMKILVAQLQHQDPLHPMEDRDFIAQMAQFSALEQMTNVSTAMGSLQKTNNLSAAYSLLGAQITGFDAKQSVVHGVVSGVTIVDGSPLLQVDGNTIKLQDITSVER